MHNFIVKSDNYYYLVRYQILKSVVTRKHTTKEGNITNRLELHNNSVVVYLYQIIYPVNLDNLVNANLKSIKFNYKNNLKYLGRGLSKCSDKDVFNKKLGIMIALYNIENINKNKINAICEIISNVDL